MHKNFTLTKFQVVSNSEKKKPRESTVDFIKQFARVCAMRKTAQPELGFFIMN